MYKVFCVFSFFLGKVVDENNNFLMYSICDRIWENPPYGTACAIVLQAFLLPMVIILRKSYFYSYG